MLMIYKFSISSQRVQCVDSKVKVADFAIHKIVAVLKA